MAARVIGMSRVLRTCLASGRDRRRHAHPRLARAATMAAIGLWHLWRLRSPCGHRCRLLPGHRRHETESAAFAASSMPKEGLEPPTRLLAPCGGDSAVESHTRSGVHGGDSRLSSPIGYQTRSRYPTAAQEFANS